MKLKAHFLCVDDNGKEHIFDERAILSLHLVDPKNPKLQVRVDNNKGAQQQSQVRMTSKTCNCDPKNIKEWHKPTSITGLPASIVACPHIDVFFLQPQQDWVKQNQ